MRLLFIGRNDFRFHRLERFQSLGYTFELTSSALGRLLGSVLQQLVTISASSGRTVVERVGRRPFSLTLLWIASHVIFCELSCFRRLWYRSRLLRRVGSGRVGTGWVCLA